MKYSFIILFILFQISGIAQTFELMNGDTINRRDANNKRQGLWISFSAQQTIIEKGNFVDNKKQGVWISYYPNNNKKSEITYQDNRPDGPATMYYENGVVSEKGIWKINKWVGDYQYFHENGNMKYEFEYNESGKRTGQQKYYYNDGGLMYKGDWNDGKKEGVLTEYYPNGSVKSEMNFADGQVDIGTIKEYQVSEKPAKKVYAKKPEYQKTSAPAAASSDSDKDYFTLTGYFKTYNEQKKLDREGDFVKGKLVNGKRYIYDDDGNLTKTLIYKDGKVISSVDAE